MLFRLPREGGKMKNGGSCERMLYEVSMGDERMSESTFLKNDAFVELGEEERTIATSRMKRRSRR